MVISHHQQIFWLLYLVRLNFMSRWLWVHGCLAVQTASVTWKDRTLYGTQASLTTIILDTKTLFTHFSLVACVIIANITIYVSHHDLHFMSWHAFLLGLRLFKERILFPFFTAIVWCIAVDSSSANVYSFFFTFIFNSLPLICFHSSRLFF